MNKLRAWYAGLEEREQRVVLIGAIALGLIVLVGGILLPMQSAVSGAQKSAAAKREDLAWMRAHEAEIRSSAPPPADTGEAPVVLVDRVGRESGLAGALRGTQPNATGGVRVQLEAAPFNAVVTWLDSLDNRYGVAIESITLDRSAAPGIVNANISFSQPRH
jgi:general secretion pathway protein M